MQRLEPRSIKFDRLTITDEEKCQERKLAGQNTGINSLAVTCIACFWDQTTSCLILLRPGILCLLGPGMPDPVSLP